MKNNLLDKLKVKPIAKSKESVEINFTKPIQESEVIIETIINDKTKEKRIDRAALRNKLATALKTTQKQPNNIAPGPVLARPALARPPVAGPALARPPVAAKKTRKTVKIMEENI